MKTEEEIRELIIHQLRHNINTKIPRYSVILLLKWVLDEHDRTGGQIEKTCVCGAKILARKDQKYCDKCTVLHWQLNLKVNKLCVKCHEPKEMFFHEEVCKDCALEYVNEHEKMMNGIFNEWVSFD